MTNCASHLFICLCFQWKATQLSVLSCNEDVICLVDFMQKVYITHPDIMLTATTLLLHSYKHSHPEIVSPVFLQVYLYNVHYNYHTCSHVVMYITL